MPTTSNAVFFGVKTPIALPESGWEVRVVALSDLSTPIAVINEYTELSVMTELNGPGAGSISINTDSPFWSTLLPGGQLAAQALVDSEYVWEAWQDGVLCAQWLGTNVAETIVGDDESHVVVVSGPGAGNVLTWAKVFPPGYPSPPADPDAYLSWGFTLSTPAMQIFLYLFNAAQRRGTIPFVKPTFTTTHDSGGVAWADVANKYNLLDPYSPVLGSDLLTQLNYTTGQDLDRNTGLRAEWVMWPGFKLDVRPVIGVHRERQIIFYEAAVSTVDRTRARDEISNIIAIRDVNGYISGVADGDSIRRWGRREELQLRANIDDKGRRDQIARVVLAQHKDERSSWTITVPYGQPDRVPFVDYHLGDWIGISHLNADGSSTVDANRIMAIAVKVGASGNPEVELTLQSVFEARQRQLEQRLTTIINTVVNNPVIPVTIPVKPPNGVPLVYHGSTNTWVPGSLGTGRPKVFIQASDPSLVAGNDVAIGDFWVETYDDPALP